MDYEVVISRNEEIGKYLITREAASIFLIHKINKTIDEDPKKRNT